MKKIIIRVVIGLALVVVVVLAVLWFSLNTIVKSGVERVGSYLTKTEVKLNSVGLSPFSGRGNLKGLFVGNPAGFRAPSAVKIGAFSVAVDINSIKSDKIVVRSIAIESAEITLEGNLKDNNLTKIMANLEEASGGGKKTTPADEKSQKAEKTADRKIQVDDLIIRNAKVNLSLNIPGVAAAQATIPEIHLTGLGTGDGITVAQLTKLVFDKILDGTTIAATDSVGKLGKVVTDAAKNLGKDAKSSVEKATKGLGDVFKK